MASQDTLSPVTTPALSPRSARGWCEMNWSLRPAGKLYRMTRLMTVALRPFLYLFFGTCMTFAAASHAADVRYPTRPIRLLVPTSPGGGTDTLARILAPRLGEIVGQQWIVDNRAGASGNIAGEFVARAVPDGYTAMLALNHVVTVNPTIYKLPYDVMRALQPVSTLAGAQYLLVLHPSVPAATVKEFVALAKQKPGTLNVASAGIGTPVHLAAALFMKRADVNLVHVPYKGGGPAAAAVLAGESQVIFGSVASSMPQVKAGRLKAL